MCAMKKCLEIECELSDRPVFSTLGVWCRVSVFCWNGGGGDRIAVVMGQVPLSEYMNIKQHIHDVYPL